MPIVANTFRYLVGVDTHAASHTFAVIECPTGALVAQATFPTTPAGLARAVAWIQRRTLPGTGGDLDPVLIAVEGTGSYGSVLCQHLADTGFRVVEAPTPTRSGGRGKTDDLDAVAAARSSLTTEITKLRDRRGTRTENDQLRVALAILTTAREQANTERLRAINALTALVRTHDLGLDARRALSSKQIDQITRWRPRHEPLGPATARARAVRLARRIVELEQELHENRDQINTLINTHAPAQAAALLATNGVGPVVAAVVLVAWGHPHRIRSEAALAMIAGTAPIPASSGNTIRHRLNSGGDRRLNKAINTIVLTRLRLDPATRTYLERRRAEGKTDREIRRCLKRYITRQLYRTLTAIEDDPSTITNAHQAAA
ncbi:MAG: IS110 family transposase [Nocardioides sp.]